MPNRRLTKRTMLGHAAAKGSRELMNQAASDLERGLKNTDCRSRDPSSGTDCPKPSPAAPSSSDSTPRGSRKR